MTDALETIRVLETAQHVAGPYCGKLLADHGAEVFKLEPPGGDVSRTRGPFPGDRPDPEQSGLFLHLNAGKKSIALDLANPTGAVALGEACAGADLLIDDGTLAASGIDVNAIERANPGLVVVSLSGFGDRGPYRDFRMNDAVAYAASGWMAAMGDPRRAPLYPGVDYPFYVAGIYAAFGALVALRHAMRTGEGQRVRVSALDASISIDFYETTKYSFRGTLRRRDGHMITGVAASTQPCLDGHIALTFAGEDDWRAFAEVIGAPELAEGEFSTAAARLALTERLDALVQQALADKRVDDVVRESQARHVAIAPVASTRDIYGSQQLRARDWFATVEHPRAGRVEHPGPPFRLERPVWRLAGGAPLLGEHDRLLEGLRSPRTRRPPRARPVAGAGALEGLRILDLTMGWAGPLGTLLFADLGAEVIKIEGPGRMDWWRSGSVSQPNPDMSDIEQRRWEQSPVFHGVNRNKRELVVDMKREEGRELFRRLVAVSDIVVESFSPRVLAGWGLGYEQLREINERIILISLPAVGSAGPWAHYVGYASTTEALAGLPALCGYDGEGPILQTPSIADPLAGLNGAVALALALVEREHSGRGQRIETAHIESVVPLIGEALMDLALNDRVRERHAAGDVSFAPNGCYRCAGDDRWVVISAPTDDEWASLCGAIGRADLIGDPRTATGPARLAAREAVDEAITAWTRAHAPRAAMEALQGAGVMAGAVNNEADLLDDPQVVASESFATIDAPYVGPHPYPNVTVRLSRTPGRIARPAPLFGEGNTHVLGGILGLTDDEIEALGRDGVIADIPNESARARLSAFGGQLQRHVQK